VVTGAIELWMFYALAIMQGLGNALEIPSRQSLLSELVPADDLPNALALNGTLYTLARIAGPAVAGALIVLVGMAECFALNAASFVVVAAAVFLIRPAEMFHRRRVTSEPGQLREGIRHGFGETLPRLLMAGSAVNGVYIGGLSAVVYSLLARDTFGGTAGTYGLMGTVSGIGAACAAVWLTRMTDVSARLILVVTGGAGVSLLVSGFAPTLALEYLALFFVGAFTLAQAVTGLAKLQLVTGPDVRGRLIALYFSANAAGAAVSGVALGALAQSSGARWAIVLGGGLGLLLCGRWYLYLRAEEPDVRRPPVQSVPQGFDGFAAEAGELAP
jgi:MFS family permease